MSSYLPRVVDEEVDELLAGLPAIALEGPKAVGKTATALRRANTVYRLEDSAERAVAEAGPDRLLTGSTPVLIDEWQRVPESWDLIRRAVDEGAAPGQFLVTGSASGAGRSTHSGAGRIVTLRMRPMSLVERGLSAATVSLHGLLSGDRQPLEGETTVGLAEYANEVVRSGFPGMRSLSGRALRAQLNGYVRRIVDRDFDELGRQVRKPTVLMSWMAAYAAASSTTASFESIRDAATSGQSDKPSKTTTIPYRDVLERLWIVDPVPAWLPRRTRIARLSSPPKHQLADPALAAELLGVDVDALLEQKQTDKPTPRDGPLLGALFESLVTLDVRVYAQAAEADVGHLRTWRGDREIDLIVQRRDGKVLAVEIKLTRVPRDEDVRHLKWLRDELGEQLLDAIVITTGPTAYRRSDGIGVVPAALLGP